MRDPVTADLRDAVLRRDRGCVAPRLGATSPCQGRLTLDHVKDQPRMGKRAPSDSAHLATVCYGHHLGGWATAHRPELRSYLHSLHGPAGEVVESDYDTEAGPTEQQIADAKWGKP